MNLLLTSATYFEVKSTIDYLDKHWQKVSERRWNSENHEIHLLVTGVGVFNTLYELKNRLNEFSYSLIIQVGIGGSYQKNKPLGKVYYIATERFGDIGMEQKDGSFTSIFETPLIDKNSFPFKEGVLINPEATLTKFLPLAHGITLNTVTGTQSKAEKIIEKYPEVEIENMEGASFFYVCLKENIPFMSIRSISNYVEDRNKEHWKMEEAIESLNKTVTDLLEILKDLSVNQA
jgi:futalosine hydrolase